MKMMDITDMLFQRTASDRQQVIAFTGISGKTHTAELIAHIAGYTCLPAEDERRLQVALKAPTAAPRAAAGLP